MALKTTHNMEFKLFIREIEMIKAISAHQNIVSYVGWARVPNGTLFFIFLPLFFVSSQSINIVIIFCRSCLLPGGLGLITEFVEGGTLAEFINNKDRFEVLRNNPEIAGQICIGIARGK